MTNYDEDDMRAMFATFTLADHVAHNIMVMQGISTLDILCKMTDAGVTQLCKNVCKKETQTNMTAMTTIPLFKTPILAPLAKPISVRPHTS